MSDVQFSAEELRDLKRLLERMGRRDALGDAASDDFFEALWERPHMIGALATLAPKTGGSWTEERMLLWLEVVEKTARLVYGLSSEWGQILEAESPTEKVRADAASDRQDRDKPAKSEVADKPKQKPRRENLEAEVLQVLNDSYRVALRRNEIAERLDANPDSVTDVLARLVALKKVEKCGAASGTSYRVPARPNGGSETCRVKDCLLAAVPGVGLCESHREALKQVQAQGATA